MNNTAEKFDLSQPTLHHYFVKAGVRENLPFAMKIRMNPDKSPWKWQVTGLNQALGFPRFGLYDDPSVGKTLVSQAFAMYMAGYGNKVVVIMPPILLDQFTESFLEWFPNYQDVFNLHVLDEGPAKRAKLFAQWRMFGWPDIMCMSYQMFSKVPRPKKLKNKDGTVREILPNNPDDFISDVLKEAGYNVAICDEAQALKKPTSMMHKTVDYLLGAESESALLLMTGTPIHNEITDAYGLIQLMTPGKYHDLKEFENMHCRYKYDEDGRERLIGYKNMDMLTTALYARGRRVTKDVLKLKDPQLIQMPVKLDPAHRALYKKLVKERFLEYGESIILADNQQSLRQKSLQIVTNPHLFSEKKIKNNVLEAVDTILEGINMQEEKVVLFANYQDSIRTLTTEMRDRGYNPATVYGGTGNNPKMIKKFLMDPTCRVMVAHPRSGGVGLNLQSVCRYVIFVEPTSVPGDFRQASDRVHRSGQKRTVSFYILKVIGTISVNSIINMLRKEGEIMRVNMDPKSILGQLMGEA